MAAWTVVFHHYVQLFELKDDSTISAFFSNYGSLGVDVFFVLSGFVMCLVTTKSSKSPAAFLTDRFFRIAPVYWFYSALIVACIFVFPKGFTYTDFNLKSLIATALFLPSWNPSGLGMYPVLTVGWTLNFEMFFYCFLACCMALSRKHFLKILFVAFAILPLVYPKGIYFSSVAGSFHLYEFLAGILLAVVWTGPGGAIVRKHRPIALAASLAGVVAGIGLLVWRGFALPLASSIIACSLMCEIYLRPDSRLIRVLVRLGDESYSTYLAHCFVIGVVLHFSGKNLSQGSQFAALIAIAIGTYSMSALSYRWLERNHPIAAMQTALIRYLARRNDRVSGTTPT